MRTCAQGVITVVDSKKYYSVISTAIHTMSYVFSFLCPVGCSSSIENEEDGKDKISEERFKDLSGVKEGGVKDKITLLIPNSWVRLLLRTLKVVAPEINSHV